MTLPAPLTTMLLSSHPGRDLPGPTHCPALALTVTLSDVMCESPLPPILPAPTSTPHVSSCPSIQAAAHVADWAASTGALSISVRYSVDADPPEFATATVTPNFDGLAIVPWSGLEDLAKALTVPCSQRGLACRLEHDPSGMAIVMRRLR